MGLRLVGWMAEGEEGGRDVELQKAGKERWSSPSSSSAYHLLLPFFRTRPDLRSFFLALLQICLPLLFDNINIVGGGLPLDRLLGISQTQHLSNLVRFVSFLLLLFTFSPPFVLLFGPW